MLRRERVPQRMPADPRHARPLRRRLEDSRPQIVSIEWPATGRQKHKGFRERRAARDG